MKLYLNNISNEIIFKEHLNEKKIRYIIYKLNNKIIKNN